MSGREFKKEAIVHVPLIIILTAALCFLMPSFTPFGILLVIGVFYFTYRSSAGRKLIMDSWVDALIRNIERTQHFAVRNLDIGIAVFSSEGRLQWRNDIFQKWAGVKKPEGKKLEEVLPLPNNAFDLLSIKDDHRLIQLEDRYYDMKYFKVETMEKPGRRGPATATGLMIYLTDVTELELLRQKYANEKLCLAYTRFDNYDEVAQGLTETALANLSGEINEILAGWAAEHQGFICRMDKEQNLIGFTAAAVEDIIEDKFTILDKIREVHVGNKIAPTMSIGVSCDGVTLEELIQNSIKALSIALGRGGDQAVVSKDRNSQFFGGTSSVSQKSTRVRARIVAQTLREQMRQAEKIIIMGHANEDFDAVGAAIGVAKMGLSLNKETYIVVSPQWAAYDRMFGLMEKSYGSNNYALNYKDIILYEEKALSVIDAKSLLILVDHHREILSASKKVLEGVKTRIIIDHHRRAEDLIEDTVLLYLEPSSSSTSELVTELTGYFDDQLEFTPGEATALYAGIVLDSKNFAIQTGERTFEAAALLRRSGLNPVLVRSIFKDDFDSIKLKSKLISEATILDPGIGISVYRGAEKGIGSSVLAAQVADSLMTIDGIFVSVAMVEYTDGTLGVSARSDGTVNVQVIMEDLGGGGHQTVAGVQLENRKAADVVHEIVKLVKKQLEEREKDESDTSGGQQ